MSIKKILTASVIIGWTAVFLVFGIVYFSTAPATAGNNTGLTNAGSSGLTLTPAEIAKHGSAGSCWVVISGKVYDLTSYIGIHPGGPGQIIPYCGKDGTTAFATKNSGASHSSYATSLLHAYFIGDFGTAVTVTPLPMGTTIPVPREEYTTLPTSGPGSPGFTLTPAEIAKHGSAGSCWVIISGKVYDLTSYIGIHPGGPGQIIPYCGKDGTTAFATQNSGASHSSYATSLLNAYFIGDFGTAVTVSPLPTGTTIPVPREEYTPLPASGPGSPGFTLTPAELAKHGSAGSCWVVISGKVYDLTSYIGIHPGGPGQIIPYCGKDGTTAFATKNSGASHSSYATSLLHAYFIGDFGTAVTVTPLLTGTTIPHRRGGDEDD